MTNVVCLFISVFLRVSLVCLEKPAEGALIRNKTHPNLLSSKQSVSFKLGRPDDTISYLIGYQGSTFSFHLIFYISVLKQSPHAFRSSFPFDHESRLITVLKVTTLNFDGSLSLFSSISSLLGFTFRTDVFRLCSLIIMWSFAAQNFGLSFCE